MESYLDPTAEEFRPRFCLLTPHIPPQIPLIRPPQFIYPFVPQTVSFSDVSVGFPQYQAIAPVPAPAAFIVQPQPLPPPSTVATRSIQLTSVPIDVSETLVRRELEVFGEVRGVQMERVLDGIVTVHFYDLRGAEWAFREIREQHMQHQSRFRDQYLGFVSIEGDACFPQPQLARGLIAGRAIWAHFVIPASNAVPDGQNQGTVVVFNLDPAVSSSQLKEIFQAFGVVKELRETPGKKHQKFVEFFDVRDAANALKEMNGKEINGKPVVIEFSRPGGFNRKYFNANNAAYICSGTNNLHPRNPRFHSPSPPPPPLKFPSHVPSNASRSFHPSNRPSVNIASNSRNPTRNQCEKNFLEASVSSLSLSGGSGNSTGEKSTNGNSRKNGRKSQSRASGSKEQQNSRNRPWKSKQVKKFDPRFLISEEAMSEKDSRTTVMIKNIPNKYSQKLLLNMLDNHCIHCNEQIAAGEDKQPLSSYDFVYLPIDFNNKCNVGYGFVNMTSPEATWRLFKAFHHQHWEVFNSRKICEVTYARVQGLEALKDHFKNSKFPCELEHYLPVVFTPPRDGKNLTEPAPLVGLNIERLISASGSSSRATDDDEDYETGGSSEQLSTGDFVHHSSCESDPVDYNEE